MKSMKDEWTVKKMNEKYEGWMKSMKDECKVPEGWIKMHKEWMKSMQDEWNCKYGEWKVWTMN